MARFEDLTGRPCPAWYATPQLGIFIHRGIFAIPAWAPRGRSIADLMRDDFENAAALSPMRSSDEQRRALAERPPSACGAQRSMYCRFWRRTSAAASS